MKRLTITSISSIVTILSLLFIASCSFLDLNPVVITTYPSDAYAVIDNQDSIYIEFSEDVETTDIEAFITITTATTNAINIKYKWLNNRKVFLTPVNPLNKGILYIIQANGVGLTTNKKKFNLGISVPFYFKEKGDPLSIISVIDNFTNTTLSETKNTIVNINTQFTIKFSLPINTNSFDNAFSISPPTKFILNWNTNNTEVTVSPKSIWTTGKQYTFTISNNLMASSEIPILESNQYTFLTQDDLTFPAVSDISTATFTRSSNTINSLNSTDFNNILYTELLLFSFNKDIDSNTVAAAFSITPRINGLFRMSSNDQVIFLPEQDTGWAPETQYEVVISTSLKDTVGNAMQKEYSTVFTSAVEYVDVSIRGSQNASLSSPTSFNINTDTNYAIIPNSTDNNSYYFELTFSKPYSTFEVRNNIESRITFQAVGGLTNSPVLSSISWDSNTVLILKYRSINSPSNTAEDFEKYYYHFLINDGNDSKTQDGHYLKEKQNLYVFTNKTP